MRGQLDFETPDPEGSAAKYIELLSTQLRAAKPSSMEVTDHEIRLRAGIFRLVWNTNLLVPITSAVFVAEPAEGRVRVRYEARLTQLVVFCVLANVFFVVNLNGWEASEGSQLTATALVWLWLFGGNYVITWFRLRDLLRRVAQRF